MIYLDHAATTPADPRVLEVIGQSMRRDFANPGAVYRIGLDAANLVEKAREEIAALLRLPASYRIIFTSGGSESNNLFIKGTAGGKAACLGLEHPSVVAPLTCAGEKNGEILSGFQKEGRLDPAKICELDDRKVRLLCLSHVNNELGSINDPGEIVPVLQSAAPNVRLFLDGVQAIGKIAIPPGFWDGVAGYSVSAHKIYGPKGIGLLIYDSRFPLAPQVHGGQQQFGVRSGTLPVPLILGLTEALKLALERVGEAQVHLGKLRRHLIAGLEDLSGRLPNLRLRFNSSVSQDHQSPAIVNFSFPPVEGEVLLHHLEAKDIFVGMGSACSAQSKKPSRILTGIGLSEEEARCSLRVSFGRENTIAEVDVFLMEFSRAYETLYPTFARKVG